jgi:general secretion pathway protein H
LGPEVIRMKNEALWIARGHHGQVEVRDPQNAGFTLLELLAVVFLVSLFLALALPSFTGIGEDRVKTDARKFASILRYLNDNAISLKETFPLKITFSDKMVIYEGPEGQKAEKMEELREVELPSQGLLREGDITVFFGPMGASEGLSVRMGGEKNSLSVELNPLSGRVKIVENEYPGGQRGVFQ